MKPIIEAPFLNYLTIAADAHRRMEEYLESQGIQWPVLGKFHESAVGQATVVLVFSIIALESFINNYAARKLGDSFVAKKMRNMGLVKKWTVVPELCAGQPLLNDDKGLEMLRHMVTIRNFIVHTKSSQITWEEFHQKIRNRRHQDKKWESELVSVSRSAFECIGLLCHRLLLVDPEEPFAILLSKFAGVSEKHQY